MRKLYVFLLLCSSYSLFALTPMGQPRRYVALSQCSQTPGCMDALIADLHDHQEGLRDWRTYRELIEAAKEQKVTIEVSKDPSKAEDAAAVYNIQVGSPGGVIMGQQTYEEKQEAPEQQIVVGGAPGYGQYYYGQPYGAFPVMVVHEEKKEEKKKTGPSTSTVLKGVARAIRPTPPRRPSRPTTRSVGVGPGPTTRSVGVGPGPTTRSVGVGPRPATASIGVGPGGPPAPSGPRPRRRATAGVGAAPLRSSEFVLSGSRGS